MQNYNYSKRVESWYQNLPKHGIDAATKKNNKYEMQYSSRKDNTTITGTATFGFLTACGETSADMNRTTGTKVNSSPISKDVGF